MKKRFSGRKKFNRILVPILCMSLIAPSILGGCGKDDDMTAIRALDKGKGTHNPDNMANAVTLGMYKIH